MRLVTTAAAIQAHRRVLECKGPSLVCVTSQTPWLVGGKGSQLLRSKTSMWIVAVNARHCALRKPVRVGSLELRPCTQVTAGALRVDLRRPVRTERDRIPMDCVAATAGNLSSGVPALNTAGVGCLIQMASQADLIRRTGTELGWIPNVFSGCRFCVFASWTVTGFAGLPGASKLFRSLNRLMRAFAEGRKNVLVTGLTDFGADILSRCHRSRWRCLRRFLPVQQGRNKAACNDCA